ncbi:MAG: ATP-binding cassette domain-containing protein [Dehalococcoidia bacterium]|nr:ATP-binding cassette domain-containing protein [Dehalococcoidia bacterium]
MPLVIEGLSKIYGNIKAVDDVSLTVPDGIVFGLLGPNGAGKTTLVRILTTLSRPTLGKARVNGLDVNTQGLAIRRLIGVVSQENNLDNYLTARENLVFHAKMHGMKRSEYDPRIDELLDMMQLAGRQKDSPRVFSGGMNRRLALARALVHRPQILFLDEPTTGLDPQARHVVWEYLKGVKGKVTIFLTTHYMEEADTLCDRVAIMDQGKILVDDSPDALKRSLHGRTSYEIEIKGPAEEYLTALRQLPFVKSVVFGDGKLVVELNSTAGTKELIEQFRDEDVLSFCLRQSSLEDVFISQTGRALRE